VVFTICRMGHRLQPFYRVLSFQAVRRSIRQPPPETRAETSDVGLPAGVSRASGKVRLRVASRRLPGDSLREKRERRLVSRIFTSWNQLGEWLRQVDGLRDVA
jgi:hypothetical protein